MTIIKKDKYRRIKELLLFIIILMSNLQCIALDMWANSLQKEVNIQPDVVEAKQQITGNIGFCGNFFYPMHGASPPSYWFNMVIMSRDNMDKLNNMFLKTIEGNISADCRYDKIKDFNYFHTFNNPYIKSRYAGGPGYAHIFDEKDQNNVWKMNYKCRGFFNEYYDCDYYLVCRCDLIFIRVTGNKGLFIEPNLLLILYDNKGFRVWSKLLKRQYVYVDKNQTTSDLYFFYMKQLITDNKLEINNTLSSIGIKFNLQNHSGY